MKENLRESIIWRNLQKQLQFMFFLEYLHMSSRVGCVWPVEHQLWLPIQFSLLPEPCKEFNSICIFKAGERFSLAANAQNCANHLSRWGNPSPCFCIRPWFQKMSPDCLRSLRTWMSSHWNVNVDGSLFTRQPGPIFSFHQFEEHPAERGKTRMGCFFHDWSSTPF